MINYFKNRSPRTKKMLIGSSSQVASRTFAAFIGFISTGLLARYLNPQEFGLWALIMSMPGFFAGFDLGFSGSLKNKLSSLYALNNEEKSHSYFFSIFYSFSCLTALLILITMLFKDLIPWASFLRTDVNLSAVSALLFNTNIIAIIASIPFSLAFSAGFYSYQESHLNSIFTALGPILTIILLLLFIQAKASFVPITMVFIFIGLLIYLVSFFVFLKIRHWKFMPFHLGIILSRTKELFSTSAQFVLIQIAAGIFFSIDPFIVGRLSGLEIAGDYYLIKKICILAVVTHLASLGAVWPAYTEAAEKKDIVWIRKALKHIAFITIGSFLIFILALYFFGNPLLKFWAGKTVDHTSWYILLGFWALVYAWGNAFSIFLNAVNNLKLQLLWSALACALVVPLSLWMGERFGLPGIILAQIILMAPATLGNTLQSWMVLKRWEKGNV